VAEKSPSWIVKHFSYEQIPHQVRNERFFCLGRAQISMHKKSIITLLIRILSRIPHSNFPFAGGVHAETHAGWFSQQSLRS
jgi:hypothetical protein